jgi:hypothetical protein
MKKLMLLALLSAACIEKPKAFEQRQQRICDAAAQERIFLACMKTLPSGPERLAASGNDWAEAVEEAGEQCRDSARDIACHYEWVKLEPGQ